MNRSRRVGLTAGGVVALVAAVASYSHMQALAAAHGQQWLSYILPLSVDGMLVAASLVIITARLAGEHRTHLAWLALVAGVLVSLLANVASAGPDLISKLVAAWPPIAFAVSFELVLRLSRASTPATRLATPGDGRQHAGVGLATAGAAPGEDVVTSDDPTPVELLERARWVVERAEGGGGTVGRIRLARELGVSRHQARQLLHQLRQAPGEDTHQAGDELATAGDPRQGPGDELAVTR